MCLANLRTMMLMTGLMAIALVAAEQDAVRDPVRGAKVVAPVDGVYELTAVHEVLLADGVTVAAGEPIYPEDVVEIGLVRNDADQSVVWLTAAGNEVEIPPGGILKTRCSQACSTAGCNDDQYACCMWDHRGCARCLCLRDDEDPPDGLSCESSGGSACSMGGGTQTVDPVDGEPWAR